MISFLVLLIDHDFFSKKSINYSYGTSLFLQLNLNKKRWENDQVFFFFFFFFSVFLSFAKVSEWGSEMKKSKSIIFYLANIHLMASSDCLGRSGLEMEGMREEQVAVSNCCRNTRRRRRRRNTGCCPMHYSWSEIFTREEEQTSNDEFFFRTTSYPSLRHTWLTAPSSLSKIDVIHLVRPVISEMWCICFIGHAAYMVAYPGTVVLKFIIRTNKAARTARRTHVRSVIYPVCMTASGVLELGVPPTGLHSPRIDRQRLPSDWLIGCLCQWATQHLAGERMSRTGGRTEEKKNTELEPVGCLSTHARGHILNIAD